MRCIIACIPILMFSGLFVCVTPYKASFPMIFGGCLTLCKATLYQLYIACQKNDSLTSLSALVVL